MLPANRERLTGNACCKQFDAFRYEVNIEISDITVEHWPMMNFLDSTLLIFAHRRTRVAVQFDNGKMLEPCAANAEGESACPCIQLNASHQCAPRISESYFSRKLSLAIGTPKPRLHSNCRGAIERCSG